MRRRQAVRQCAEAAADGLHRQMQQRTRRPRPATTAISMPGQVGRQRRSAKISAAEPTPIASAAGLSVGSAVAERHELGNSGPGSAPAASAAEILELAGQDRDRDAAGEADGHGMRNVADQRTEPQQADQDQHQRRTARPSAAALRGRICATVAATSDDEGAGRAADLVAAAAQRRDYKAADDGGVEPSLRATRPRRRRSPSTAAAPRSRRSAPPAYPCEAREAVALGQRGRELRTIEMRGGGPSGMAG